MAKHTVYIKTSIIGYLTSWPRKDPLIAGQQTLTREWWDQDRNDFDLVTSAVVRSEAAAGDATAAAERLDVIDTLRFLTITPESVVLAQALLSRLAIPLTEDRDAAHVGIAAVHGVNYLLTWNCRHLANATLRPRIELVCREQGFEPPIMHTTGIAKGIAMKDDPILEEAREAGRAYFARFNHDLNVAFEDLRQQTEELRRLGREVVSLPPRRPQMQPPAAKKAG
jgi:hypothetical protein